MLDLFGTDTQPRDFMRAFLSREMFVNVDIAQSPLPPVPILYRSVSQAHLPIVQIEF